MLPCSIQSWLLAQVCFVFQEVDLCLEAQWDTATALRAAASHALLLLVAGKALPVLAGFVSEGRARERFLRDR